MPTCYDLNRTGNPARAAGHSVRFGIDGRHHQAGHQSTQAGASSKGRLRWTSLKPRDGSTNGGGSLMLNLPLGEIAALRTVTTGQIRQRLDRSQGDRAAGRISVADSMPGRRDGPCAPITANAATWSTRPSRKSQRRQPRTASFRRERSCWSSRPIPCRSPTTLMYQRIEADGYNNYQSPPGGLDALSALRPTRALLRCLQDVEPQGRVQLRPGDPDLRHQLLEARCRAIDRLDRGLAEHQQPYSSGQRAYVPNFIPNLYSEDDPTTQFAEELRLTSNDSGKLQVGRRTVLSPSSTRATSPTIRSLDLQPR